MSLRDSKSGWGDWIRTHLRKGYRAGRPAPPCAQVPRYAPSRNVLQSLYLQLIRSGVSSTHRGASGARDKQTGPPAIQTVSPTPSVPSGMLNQRLEIGSARARLSWLTARSSRASNPRACNEPEAGPRAGWERGAEGARRGVADAFGDWIRTSDPCAQVAHLGFPATLCNSTLLPNR